jgi:hypothetical protein
MTRRYIVSAIAPRSIAAGDDWYSDPRETINVIVDDQGPTNTGLVDQYGVTIYRLPGRERCGF